VQSRTWLRIGTRRDSRTKTGRSRFIEVPADGLYRFFVDSDDGSIMKLHGTVVVDNDGPHSATEKSGAIALEKGLHPVEIRMLEAAGQDLLRVSWRGPGMTRKAVVPAAAWKH
jgi:hypothetical protein